MTRSSINWKDKCWVATIYLVNDEKKVLLTWNKNLQTWIPAGGQIDYGETPEEAIVREVAEETGFAFEFFVQETKEYEKTRRMKNQKVQIDKTPHHGLHMNFIFYGKCTQFSERTATDEEEKLRWFSEEELIKEKEDFLPNVFDDALNALKCVKF